MAGDKASQIQTLEKPEDLKKLLREDRGDDCLPCRLVGEFCPRPWPNSELMFAFIGSGAFLGLAAYTYFSGHSQLQQQQARILASKSMFGMRSRQFGITGISIGLAWLGIWRFMK